MLQTYVRPDIVFTHAKGVRMWDAHGKEYLDFAAGIAVNSVGNPSQPLEQTPCHVETHSSSQKGTSLGHWSLAPVCSQVMLIQGGWQLSMSKQLSSHTPPISFIQNLG